VRNQASPRLAWSLLGTSPMSDLKVPKRRVIVGATLVDGSRRELTVFLAEAAPGHSGGERLSDLLNGGSDFIPALEAGAGEMTFLNRAAVMIAEADMEAERSRVDELTIPTEHAVRVELMAGRTLRGHVSYVLPPDRSRLADFLNAGTLFLPLYEESRVLLVHKRHIARVVLVE
jgi:hypothetical protein